MISLSAKIVTLHQALAEAEIPHAFGGALALAWCTARARATINIDLNVWLSADAVELVFAALPDGVKRTNRDRAAVRKEGQVRLWWDHTPVDLFFNSTEFHDEAARRTRWEQFAGGEIPFLSCLDIAVFKAFFNRTKDWADLEEMRDAGTLDVSRVAAVLIDYLGVDDQRIARLNRIG